MYKKIERPARRFNPLHIPHKLQAALPYASKPKLMRKQKSQTYLQEGQWRKEKKGGKKGREEEEIGQGGGKAG